MFRYELQVTTLKETLSRDADPEWHHVKYCVSQRSLRRLYWFKVNLLQESPLVYRMYDKKKDEVIPA